jgi:hypothetical protein
MKALEVKDVKLRSVEGKVSGAKMAQLKGNSIKNKSTPLGRNPPYFKIFSLFFLA